MGDSGQTTGKCAEEAGDGAIRVEVAYARPDIQRVIEVDSPAGAVVRDVIQRSGIAKLFPELDVANCPIGVFGRTVPDDYVPRHGDRIEIYRPLSLDPREARRVRAASRR